MTAEAAAAVKWHKRFAVPLFVATIVTGSFLLFLTQPMVGRMALPRLGGAPAVWNSAMLVFQALLLAGYAYAHWLGRFPPKVQAGVHLGAFAIAALWLPIGLRASIPPVEASPVLWVPWFLVSSIGPLFFVISAQAPLMQRWFALDARRGEPYALYAASNLGSFGGLISYPLLVEPMMTLGEQSLLWTGGYALLVLLVACCALTVPSRTVDAAPTTHSPPPTVRRLFYWMALAAVPSGLMLSTTTHLTTDIVAVPLLWALPLGLYLLSFVVAFASRRGITTFVTQLAPLIVLIAGGLAFEGGTQRPISAATMGLSLLFIVAVALHGEMYRTRPQPDRLTSFYLAMSVGGVLGGIFCAVVAPLIFDWVYEHPLLIIGAALLVPQRPYLASLERLWSDPRWRRLLPLLVMLAVLLLMLVAVRSMAGAHPEWVLTTAQILIGLLGVFSIGRPLVFAVCLAGLMMSFGGFNTVKMSLSDARTRSYFGVYTVAARPARDAVTLTHGTTLHGLQNLTPGRELEPTTYYMRDSGVGLAMSTVPALFGPRARIGVVGLGSGTLACYAVPGQDWRFFEIDPAMVRIATRTGYFTFIRNCMPKAAIVVGDARLTLAKEAPGRFDALAIDAFSSDSVPMHLLTQEAFGIYGRALKPNGILLVHISNRYLKLEPVVAAAAEKGGWAALVLSYRPGEEDKARNATPSEWVVMSRSQDTLDRMLFSSGKFAKWEILKPKPGFKPWTDDYATILPLLKDLTT